MDPSPASRRWRVIVTVFAWLLLVQSGLGLVSGLVSIPLAGAFRAESIASRLGPLAAGADFAGIDRLLARFRALNLAQVGLAGVIVAGSVGLLLRRKWGWYTIVIVHVLETVTVFVFGVPALRPVLALLDPARAGPLSVLIAALAALVPAALVAFLLSGGVVRQFESRDAGAGNG